MDRIRTYYVQGYVAQGIGPGFVLRAKTREAAEERARDKMARAYAHVLDGLRPGASASLCTPNRVRQWAAPKA